MAKTAVAMARYRSGKASASGAGSGAASQKATKALLIENMNEAQIDDEMQKLSVILKELNPLWAKIELPIRKKQERCVKHSHLGMVA